MTVTRDWVAALPKAELHVHLDGCLRPETMIELADADEVDLPARDPDTLRERMLVRHARNLEEYLERYTLTLAVMQTAAGLERIAAEFVADVASEGIRYVEVRFCPALHPGAGDEGALEAVTAGLVRGAAAHGVRTGVIVCALRTLPPSLGRAMATLAVRWKDRGVVAFDLAGSEAGHPAEQHADAFAIARDGGLHRTCHAGEAAGPESIRAALDACHAERLGHGVRLREDPDLLARVRDAGIPLEMCPTSNLHTGTVASLAAHPLGRYVSEGLAVTVNTDSRLMDRTTLVDEYLAVSETFGLDREALVRIARTAFAHAFVPPDDRTTLLAAFDAAVEELA